MFVYNALRVCYEFWRIEMSPRIDLVFATFSWLFMIALIAGTIAAVWGS